jgi:hypothetical protein
MLIKPRVVEPGYLKRWARETFELLRQAPETWILLAIIFAATGYIAYPLLGTGQAILCVWQMFVAVELARIASEGPIHIPDLVKALRLAGPRSLQYFREAPYPTLMVLGFSCFPILLRLVPFIIGWDTPLHALVDFDPSSTHAWLFARNSPLACSEYGVMWGVCMAGTTYFALTVMFGVAEGGTLRSLTFMAISMNRQAVFLSIAAGWIVLFIGYILPAVAPFAAVAFPIFCFVVTRDLFLNGDGNKKLVRSRQHARVVARPA